MSTLRTRTAALKPGIPASAAGSLWPVAAVFALALVLQIFIRPHLGDFYAKVLLDIGINIVLAVSLTMVNGFTGQFSIGHAAFMMVGAYVAAGIVYYGALLGHGTVEMTGGLASSMMHDRDGAWFTVSDGVFALAVLVGGAAAAACGYVVGLPSLRLKGDYLAIVTLGFGEIVRVLIQSQTADVLYTAEEVRATAWYALPTRVGGALGFSGLPFYTSLFWVFLAVSLTMLVAFRLKESATGRAFLSIREDEIAAEAMGVNTTQFKVRAFVVSAFFAGVAGALFAHTIGVQLNPGELGFLKSFDIIIMVVLGGLGSVSGAAIAAVILTILPEFLRSPEPLVRAWPVLAVLAVVFALGAAVARSTGRRARPLVAWSAAACAFIALGFVAKYATSSGVDLGRYRMILFALALVGMMILRPQGLFGVREIWERAFWRGMVQAIGHSRRRT